MKYLTPEMGNYYFISTFCLLWNGRNNHAHSTDYEHKDSKKDTSGNF